MSADTLLTILIYDLKEALKTQNQGHVDAGHLVRALDTATKIYEIMNDTYPLAPDVAVANVIKTNDLNPNPAEAKLQNILIDFKPPTTQTNYKQIVRGEVETRMVAAQQRLAKMNPAQADPREVEQVQKTINVLNQLLAFTNSPALTSDLIDVDAITVFNSSNKPAVDKLADFMTSMLTDHRSMFQARYLERVLHHLSVIMLDDARELSVISLYRNMTLGRNQVEEYFMQIATPARKLKLIQNVYEVIQAYNGKINQTISLDAKNMFAFEAKNQLILILCDFIGMNHVKGVHKKLYELTSAILKTLTTDEFKKWFTNVGGGRLLRTKDMYEMFKVLSDSFSTQHYLEHGVTTEMAAFRNAMRTLESNFNFTVGADLEAPTEVIRADVLPGGVF